MRIMSSTSLTPFKGEDLGVKNLVFEGKNKNNKIEDEDKVIKNEK